LYLSLEVVLQYSIVAYGKTKKIIWVEATGTNLLLDPNVGAVVVNFRDITDRKVSEEKLTREKEEDAAMLASIGEGIVATDETGRIALVNDAAVQMLGLERKEMIGQNLIDLVQMYDKAGKIFPQSLRPMTKVLLHGKTIVSSPENFYERADKSKFPVQFTLTPILLKKKVVGTVEVFRDITQEAAVDKAKSEFVSLASHQLRTPLATINWYLERLLNEELGHMKPDQHKYLDEVYHASKRMVDLINTLLNVSRLDLGTFVVEPEMVSLSTLLTEVLQEFAKQISTKDLVVKKDVAEKLPQMNADPKLLRIIMQNLIGNAIEYSNDKGKVDIKISFDTKNYTLTVSDNGIGIPKKDTDKIFTKMFRSDNAKMHDAGGNGLGLYLVKTIINKTGGKIWFESEEGNTTFFVSFPLSGMKKKDGDKQLR
jgi:two-component system sensor histidine kinase VicK